MSASRATALLRQRLSAPPAGGRVAFGAAAIDTALGGGLAAAGLHECLAGRDDATAAAAFALLLTLRAGAGSVVWVREARADARARLDTHGLVALGADPGALILVTPDDAGGVLRAGDDVVRHGGAAAVIVELVGGARGWDLTASRRLSLAARARGVFAQVLLIDSAERPSAADTRWAVASAPSDPLEADAPGHPAFDLTLLRRRGGIAGLAARLEWNRDDRAFTPLSGRAPADAVGGTHGTARAA